MNEDSRQEERFRRGAGPYSLFEALAKLDDPHLSMPPDAAQWLGERLIEKARLAKEGQRSRAV